MRWTLPNILTVLRLAAAPAVPLMFLYWARPYADIAALMIFLLAAVTDWFDGYLARAWKQETKIGTMLDPIADKAMVVIALMVIAAYSSYSPWLVLIWIAAVLTGWTGWDYFVKALPYLKDPAHDA